MVTSPSSYAYASELSGPLKQVARVWNQYRLAAETVRHHRSQAAAGQSWPSPPGVPATELRLSPFADLLPKHLDFCAQALDLPQRGRMIS
jgi:hypothetical protein